jgi:hypothetical protein
MEAAVIEKPDDSTVTLAPIQRMAKKLKTIARTEGYLHPA